MSDSIDLDVIDTMIDVSESVSDEVVYPSLLIEGITSQEEVLFIRKNSKGGSVLPLYVKFAGVCKCIGEFALTLDNLLMLHAISNYRLLLLKDEQREIPIDLSNPQAMVKFCSIF